MGWNYRSLFHNQEDVERYLLSIPVGIIVIDAKSQLFPHGRLLLETLRNRPGEWIQLARYSPGQDQILVFRLVGHEGRPIGNINVPMPIADALAK